MRSWKFIFFSILSLLLLRSVSEAATPKGVVTLTADKLFKSGAVQCGYVRKQWIPGRLLNASKFYSRTAERNNLLKQAKKLSGSKRTKLKKKAAKLLSKRQVETPTCAEGPPSSATPTPTFTATPSGTATPSPTATPTPTPTIGLVTLNPRLYHTDHAIFIIPEPGQVDFNGSSSYDSVYSTANMNSYINTLKTAFPDDYFSVVISAAHLLPDRVPNALTFRRIATGIGQDSITGEGIPNICRYNTGDNVGLGMFAVLEHEIGHNWGVNIGSEFGEGHWRTNTNASGQMADYFSDDNYTTAKRITGNPVSGFRWTSYNILSLNESEIYSGHELYLMGLNSTFPTYYVLTSPVYNTDGSVSHSGVATYDQAFVEARHGVRNPSYRTSPKRLRYGFIHVVRDVAEVNTSYQFVEKSIRHFIYAEEIDRANYRFQVPFTVATSFRASIDARLANIDGNRPPTLTTSAPHYTTSTGSLVVPVTVSDPDGGTPTVSCVPASSGCSVSGTTVTVSGLSAGGHFFTIKAEDSSGKKTFAHFVVDAS